MVQIGKLNRLRIIKFVDFGAYLDGLDRGEILLPQNELPPDCQEDQEIEVFVGFDSEDRLVASLSQPDVMVGEFALLKVVAIERVGAFLDWGLPKDLFLPFAEQNRRLEVGEDVIVFVYLDKTERISASMRIEKFLSKISVGQYQAGQAVELIIFDHTELGFKAIINGSHQGMLFENEVFQTLTYGQKISGFIQKLREDGKIDLSLNRPGHDVVGDLAPRILEHLQDEGGFLPINDKTSAELIYQLFGVSKKKYKIALGGLYKKRLILVEEDGIRLAPSVKK